MSFGHAKKMLLSYWRGQLSFGKTGWISFGLVHLVFPNSYLLWALIGYFAIHYIPGFISVLPTMPDRTWLEKPEIAPYLYCYILIFPAFVYMLCLAPLIRSFSRLLKSGRLKARSWVGLVILLAYIGVSASGWIYYLFTLPKEFLN